jgi:hypothetical protein
MQQNFSMSVGKTEEHLLRHLLYAGAFAHCANWLLKLTPGVNDQLFLFGTSASAK